MDIYKDIQKELVRQGYHVDFIPEGKYAEDPDNIRGYKGIKKTIVCETKKNLQNGILKNGFLC